MKKMSSFWNRFKSGFQTAIEAKLLHWTPKRAERYVLKKTKEQVKKEKKEARKNEKQARKAEKKR